MAEHTTPASIADALERAAADLRALDDVTFSAVVLQLNLQAVRRDYIKQADRIATVDLIGQALVGAGGDRREGSEMYSLPYEAIFRRGDCDVAVYTGFDEPAAVDVPPNAGSAS